MVGEVAEVGEVIEEVAEVVGEVIGVVGEVVGVVGEVVGVVAEVFDAGVVTSLYLRKKLKKTSYELLTDNKPKVSYFRVFGYKCFILNKKSKSSKFAPKVDEGFLLSYGSNEHAYRVFNKTSGRVEIVVDVTFDESNGSQVEQVDSSVVGKEDPPCEAIK